MTDATLTATGTAAERRAGGPIARMFSLLSRESSSGEFIPEIDGLRFVAIMSVVFYHLSDFTVQKLELAWRSDALAVLFHKGNFGVQLFFVISGFIIAHPFAKRLLAGESGVPLGRYLTRRLTRLEPPYVINLLVAFTLLIVVKGESFEELWPHLVASVLYLHNAIFGSFSLINGVAWSLEIECQFYLLAPLLVAVFRLRSTVGRRALLVVAIAVTSFVSVFALGSSSRLQLSLVNFIGYFLTGFLLADVYLVSWQGRPKLSRAWDVAGGLCWIAIVVLLYQPRALHVLLPAPILGAYLAAFRGPIGNAVFRNRLIYTIGGMCYTIYLYHFFLISLAGRMVIGVPAAMELPVWGTLIVMIALVTPPVLVVCSVIFLVTEKPFMKRNWPLAWRNRLAEALDR